MHATVWGQMIAGDIVLFAFIEHIMGSNLR